MLENAYFDNAATTWPKPEVVYTFADQFQRSHGVNPGRSGSQLATEAADLIALTRRQLAACFNQPDHPERVIFTANGSDSLNMAVQGLVQAGDHVVSTRLEHNAVARLLRHLERDRSVKVDWLPVGDNGRVQADSLASTLDTGTRALVLTHASNVTGKVQPIADIARQADQRHIPVVLDAAQTAGVVPLDMAAQPGLAAVACPAHKGLLGPMGLGILVVSTSVDLAPVRFGGTGVRSLEPFQPDDYPWRLEAGSLPLPAIAGLHAAQAWMAALGQQCLDGAVPNPEQQRLMALDLPLRSADFDAERHRQCCVAAINEFHRVEMRHRERIEERLSRCSAVRLLGGSSADEPVVATLSFVVDGMPTSMVADMLDADHHIIARAGLHCAPMVHLDAGVDETEGAIRLSPGYFTSEAEMVQLIDALDALLPA